MVPGVRITVVVSIILSIVLSLAERHHALAGETIRINGSGAALDILKPMILEYRKKHPQVNFRMDRPLGSTGAIKALLAGVVDVAVSSKILTPEESAQGALASDYGKIPLAVVSTAGVGKKEITTRELEDIYTGKLTKWPNGETIRIILRPREDIDTKILGELSPGMGRALREAHKKPGMIFSITDPEATESIIKTPGAIGTAAICCVIDNKGRLNALSLNGRKASAKGVADGTYPLAKDLRFITIRKTPPAALDFLRFVYSAKGRAIAEKEGILVTAKDAGRS
ncbi:periplasmic solute-binding protein [Geotalea daltonii FRC-32]|uniref:Periplasmic solute-binding protein n=1 Tax=Geotalea daltonii (strain DSM 22248 / JCM 15807 / FRC-32) TaxID=316067 RepID=B9M1S5_GEODF|nr:substrate-binding domain-containing protein [Geotalea daltonii]ACM19221.1 periplasmic solute-binding protein [Geotalea daltonii FRC-32]